VVPKSEHKEDPAKDLAHHFQDNCTKIEAKNEQANFLRYLGHKIARNTNCFVEVDKKSAVLVEWQFADQNACSVQYVRKNAGQTGQRNSPMVFFQLGPTNLIIVFKKGE
jgi:hypothetical protein